MSTKTKLCKKCKILLPQKKNEVDLMAMGTRWRGGGGGGGTAQDRTLARTGSDSKHHPTPCAL